MCGSAHPRTLAEPRLWLASCGAAASERRPCAGGARGRTIAPVSLLVLVFAAILAGLVLIALAGRGQRGSPAAREAPAPDAAPELAWVRDLGVEGLERMLVALFTEMGFTTEPVGRAARSVELHAWDPAPIRGGRLRVHGVLTDPGVPVGADEVRGAVEAARAESVGKAVLVTLGRFSGEARAAAKDDPIDLLDGDALAALVKRHLPQAWATRTI